MPVPTAGTLAAELYSDALAPYTRADAAHGYALGTFLMALTLGAEDIATLVRDDPETGAVGWSAIVDADRAPEWALPWLAALVGVRDDAALTEAERRDRIKTRAGQQRGTLKAITDAPKPFLTGTKTVTVTERVGGNAWQLAVSTLAAETPDPDRVEAAIRAEKPAGIVLTYTTT
jgi:hypothetical protein